MAATFEKDYNKMTGGLTITRKAFNSAGKPIGPSKGVYVYLNVGHNNEKRAEEVYQKFAADWRGSIEEYGVSVEING